jgi:hypothetical protein
MIFSNAIWKGMKAGDIDPHAERGYGYSISGGQGFIKLISLHLGAPG